MPVMDCGSQFPLPGGRRAVARGVAARETFRQKQVLRFDADYLIKARNHSIGRNRDAALFLAHLSFLRNLGTIKPQAAVEWDRAHVQAIKGDEFSDAAHRLPCQILIDRQYPWNLCTAKDIDGRRAMVELRTLFGDVWSLPKVFNAADSIAESRCLRGALVEACSYVIGKTKPIIRQAGVLKRGGGLDYGTILVTTRYVSSPAAGIDRKAVTDAYAVWIAQSVRSFERAIQHVQENGATVRGEDRSDDIVYILERYIRFASEPPALFSGNNLFELEQSLRPAKP